MVFSQNLSYDSRRFPVLSFRGEAEALHGEEYAALNWFQSITNVWKRSSDYYTHSVFDVRFAHLGLNSDRSNAFGSGHGSQEEWPLNIQPVYFVSVFLNEPTTRLYYVAHQS